MPRILPLEAAQKAERDTAAVQQVLGEMMEKDLCMAEEEPFSGYMSDEEVVSLRQRIRGDREKASASLLRRFEQFARWMRYDPERARAEAEVKRREAALARAVAEAARARADETRLRDEEERARVAEAARLGAEEERARVEQARVERRRQDLASVLHDPSNCPHRFILEELEHARRNLKSGRDVLFGFSEAQGEFDRIRRLREQEAALLSNSLAFAASRSDAVFQRGKNAGRTYLDVWRNDPRVLTWWLEDGPGRHNHFGQFAAKIIDNGFTVADVVGESSRRKRDSPRHTESSPKRARLSPKR
jgi:hypothetical protein